MIHDALRGVRVNRRIRRRDKIRAPGAGAAGSKESRFCGSGRHFESASKGSSTRQMNSFLAWQFDGGEETKDSDSDNDAVYVNKVGTFGGVSCASYWWTRIAACGIRATHHLLGPLFLLKLLRYADDLELIGRDRSGRMGIPLAFVFRAALGFPFKWAKIRGGVHVEWLGMETEYPSHKLGLSAKRASWLVNWLRKICATRSISSRNLAEGLGRRGFAALALKWEKPFLGPLYCWSSAILSYTGEDWRDEDPRHDQGQAERLEGDDRLEEKKR